MACAGGSAYKCTFLDSRISLSLALPRRLGRSLVACPSMLGLGLGQSPGSTAVIFAIWLLLRAQKDTWSVEARASTGSVEMFCTAHTPARFLLIFGVHVEGTWGTKHLPRISLILTYVETVGTPRRHTKLQTGPDNAKARVDHILG